MSSSKLKTSDVFSFLNKYFLIILILIIAVCLRTYQLDKSIWLQSGYDESRDMLVASHIVNYGEHISRGPLVAGGMNWLLNSPIYYYFVSIIWFFTREPTIFMYVWAAIMTIPVWIGYLIGKRLKDDLTGLILASLLAANHQMIYSSRELLQPHLLLIFSLCFIWTGISFLKDKKHKLKYILLAILFLLSPLHFHYGVFIALPIGTIWILKFWYDLNSETEKTSLKKIFAPVIVYFGMVLSWLLVTYRVAVFDQIYFLLFNFENKYQLSFFSQLRQTFSILIEMIWGSYYPISISLLLLITAIALISRAIHKEKNKFELSQFGWVVIFVFSICSSILLFGFYRHFVTETYMLFLFPFFITLLAIVLRQTINAYKIFGYLLTAASILLMIFSNRGYFLNHLPEVSFKAQQKDIAKKIYDHYNSFYK